jgi:hypothetical protein
MCKKYYKKINETTPPPVKILTRENQLTLITHERVTHEREREREMTLR